MSGEFGGRVPLSEFLLARYDEDEAAVKDPHALSVEYRVDDWAAEELARRVLADLEAKRRIVKLHQIEVIQPLAWGDSDSPPTIVDPDSFEGIVARRWACRVCANYGEDGPCMTLRLLAMPYVGHESFLEHWRM